MTNGLSGRAGGTITDEKNALDVRIARSFFLTSSVVLALLLVFGMIAPVVGSAASAAMLVVLGGFSGDYRKRTEDGTMEYLQNATMKSFLRNDRASPA